MSKSLGVALGLVNSYIKNLISKGFITISSIPRNRYKYYLTPRGLSEKTRLTYTHLQNFTNLYSVARRDFRKALTEMAAAGIKRVALCGVDEVAEIAYLSLKEVDMELAAIFDDAELSQGAKRGFFGHSVLPIGEAKRLDFDVIVITSFNKGDELKARLKDAGVDDARICDISRGGWLKKI